VLLVDEGGGGFGVREQAADAAVVLTLFCRHLIIFLEFLLLRA
jgi:hypothetical protein